METSYLIALNLENGDRSLEYPLPLTVQQAPYKYEIALRAYSLQFNGNATNHPIIVVCNLINQNSFYNGEQFSSLNFILFSKSNGLENGDFSQPIYHQITVFEESLKIKFLPASPQKAHLIIHLRPIC